LTSINALSRPLSNAEDVEVGSVATAVVAMDHLAVEEANSEEAVVKAVEDAVDVAMDHLAVDAFLLVEAQHPSTPVTPVPSQAWGHKVLSQ
jgi:hypothetical protein